MAWKFTRCVGWAIIQPLFSIAMPGVINISGYVHAVNLLFKILCPDGNALSSHTYTLNTDKQHLMMSNSTHEHMWDGMMLSVVVHDNLRGKYFILQTAQTQHSGRGKLRKLSKLADAVFESLFIFIMFISYHGYGYLLYNNAIFHTI